VTYPYAADPAQMQGYAQSQQPPVPQPPMAQAPAPQAPPVPQPPQGYAPQQGGYPAQQGAYPVAPPMGYAPQPPNPYGGGYPMQPGYPMAPPMAAAPVTTTTQFAAPTLDSFFSQPSVGGGLSWQFNQQTPVGTRYVGMVARPVNRGDVEYQTAPSPYPNAPAQVLTYKDGRPKELLKVPMLVPIDQRYTEGRAQFYVQGGTRDELARAMAAAGAPEGPPEDGALIVATKASEYRNNFGTMSARIAVEYYRPGPQTDQAALSMGITPSKAHEVPAGAAPAAAPAPAPAPQQLAPPAPQHVAAQVPPVQPQQAPQQAAPPAQPPAPGPAPTGLDPQQQQVLAGLLGQQQG
jgi:hypothetical protein